MKSLIESLERKYMMRVMMHLYTHDSPQTKMDVIKELGGTRQTVHNCFFALERMGLVEVDYAPKQFNSRYIKLTWYGNQIARNLYECECLYEKLQS